VNSVHHEKTSGISVIPNGIILRISFYDESAVNFVNSDFQKNFVLHENTIIFSCDRLLHGCKTTCNIADSMNLQMVEDQWYSSI
jgi:hypothetical protein